MHGHRLLLFLAVAGFLPLGRAGYTILVCFVLKD